MAAAFFGEGTIDAHAWVGPVLWALLDEGPALLMQALGQLRPHSAKQRHELQNSKDHFAAQHDRMRYPDFIAQQLPIGSRRRRGHLPLARLPTHTKAAGVRWTKSGAQAVLNLRCLSLSRRLVR